MKERKGVSNLILFPLKILYMIYHLGLVLLYFSIGAFGTVPVPPFSLEMLMFVALIYTVLTVFDITSYAEFMGDKEVGSRLLKKRKKKYQKGRIYSLFAHSLNLAFIISVMLFMQYAYNIFFRLITMTIFVVMIATHFKSKGFIRQNYIESEFA